LYDLAKIEQTCMADVQNRCTNQIDP
jgi:hypothetical protein